MHDVAAPAPMPDVEGVSHRFVDAAGLRMHVAEAGPADAPPVVLLHGWPQHWYEWRGLVPELSQHYRMLMPDLRGLGWTDAPRDGYEKENLARDVVNLLDALEMERVNLVGHDWGGYTGFLVCLLAPERVDRFVALNIIHPWPSRSPGRFLHVWRMAYQLPLVAPFIGPRVTRTPAFKNALRRAMNGAVTEAELEAFAAPLREPDRARASSAYYRSFQFHDLLLLAGGHWRSYRLTAPTLMLHGTGDAVIQPSFLTGYEPYADDMQVEFVERTGHFIADAAPAVVARRALEFFSAR